MNIAQTHLDISRERFLELMADGRIAKAEAAIIAIREADEFIGVYEEIGYKPAEQAPERVRFKGCKACYGSGGKVGNPCAKCGGSGKVVAE